MGKLKAVDAGKLPEGQSLAGLLGKLGEGEELTVQLEHDPASLLKGLLDQERGRYDFSPLAQGPVVWAYHFAARPANDPRTVTSYLAWDHDRLDEMLRCAMASASDGNWQESRRNLEPFRLGLFRHIQLEEEILFPAFEERTGMRDSGPTAVMRSEHVEIKKAVDEMLLAGRDEELDSLERWQANLLGVLVEHNMKEEQILYPGTDHLLSDGMRDELVRLLLLA